MSLNSTCEFAVYYIPTNKSFYSFGSKILGYDIKNAKLIDPSLQYQEIQDLNENSKIYGFHLTITDVVTIDECKLDQAVHNTKKIFKIPIFRSIVLIKQDIKVMPNANIFAIMYKYSFKLLLLHAMLILFVQRLGHSSGYLLNIGNLSPTRKLKTKYFLSPYIFNDYLPHISLVSNINDTNKYLMANFLNTKINKQKKIKLDKLAIVVRNKGEKYFRVSQYIS